MIIVQRLARIPSHLRLGATVLGLKLGLSSLLLASPAFALDYTLDLFSGVEFTDNIDRLPDNQALEGYEANIGSHIGLNHTGRKITLNAQYLAIYSDYKNNRIENNNEVTGSSDLAWQIIDNRLTWNAEHYISEVLSNNNRVNTPDNRERRQILTTGPTLTTHLSSVDDLIFLAEYTQVNQDDAINENLSQRSNINSNRAEGVITWVHELSGTSALEVGGIGSETQFDNNSPDFKYQQIFIGYRVQLASGDYNIRLGTNQAKRSGPGDTEKGAYTAIEFNREIKGDNLAINIIRQLTDSSIGLDSDTSNTNINNFDTINIVERTHFDINYTLQNICRGCVANINYSFDHEDFQNDISTSTSNRDNKDNRIAATLDYRINSRLSSRTMASYLITTFNELDRRDKTIEVETSLNWQLSEKLGLRAYLAYDNRDTNLDGLLDIDYNASIAGITATYTIK